MQSDDLLVHNRGSAGGYGERDQQADADEQVKRRKIDVLSAIK
jgi:hypothetical protein